MRPAASQRPPSPRKPWSRRILDWATPRVRDRWHPVRLAGVATADTFVPAMPTKTLLIASTALARDRWLRFGLASGFGNGMGAVLLAGALIAGVSAFGGAPDLAPGSFFESVRTFVASYGFLALLLLASVPWAHRTLTILSVLAGLSLVEISIAMLCGRPVAFAILSFAASKLPAGKLHCPWPHGQLEHQLEQSSARRASVDAEIVSGVQTVSPSGPLSK
jgi:membrane protein YqaA with SNARE-associated domain